jgi:uncharacterized protein YecT (DUF1311 family)
MGEGNMALIKCIECRTEISDKASACVKCGAPVAANHSAKASDVAIKGLNVFGNLIKVILYGSLASVLLLVVIGLYYSSNNSEKQRSSPPETVPTESAIPVDATRLFDDYKANEVSADNSYKGRQLAVAGVVQSINKDFSDDTYLALATANEFMPVHADLQQRFIGQAASLVKGQSITVICTGSGMVVGSPILKDCAIAPPESSHAVIPAPTPPQGDTTTPSANVAPQASQPPTAVVDKAKMFETSFDCTKAKSTPELLICGDQELAELDTRLAQLFAQAKAATPDKQAFAEENRRAWNWREQNCTDKTCLAAWYADRKQDLTNILR